MKTMKTNATIMWSNLKTFLLGERDGKGKRIDLNGLVYRNHHEFVIRVSFLHYTLGIHLRQVDNLIVVTANATDRPDVTSLSSWFSQLFGGGGWGGWWGDDGGGWLMSRVNDGLSTITGTHATCCVCNKWLTAMLSRLLVLLVRNTSKDFKLFIFHLWDSFSIKYELTFGHNGS